MRFTIALYMKSTSFRKLVSLQHAAEHTVGMQTNIFEICEYKKLQMLDTNRLMIAANM